LPKTRASFLKRQREIAKKEQREAKLQRKRDRKTSEVVEAELEPLSGPPDLSGSEELPTPSPE
jgi:hypothetical protein